LVEFDRSRAIASLKFGQPVISVWLDEIHAAKAKIDDVDDLNLSDFNLEIQENR